MMSQLLNNRYRILQPLGSGGFGDTFLAEDTNLPSQRRCVLKKLKPVQQNPQIYQLVKDRFQREAVILEDLGNDNAQIPTLYAYFESGNEFYLVQEWIEGESLDQRLQREGLFSDSAVRSLLTQLLPVLDFVHQRRIVHRDIKPDNIILRANGGQPVLIDFGAVKETMGTVLNSAGKSTSSIVIGTPGFMPQEQAVGRPVFASDLFGLGLTAIYLLSGCHPSELTTDPLTGEIVWRDRAPMVSPTLANVLDRAICSHARDRYPTAQAMLQALQGNVIPPTTTSPPQPLIIAPTPQTPTVVAPTPLSVAPARGFSDFQKMLMTGSVVGIFVGGAIALAQIPQILSNRSKSDQSAEPTNAETVEEETKANVQINADPPTSQSPQPVSTELPREPTPVPQPLLLIEPDPVQTTPAPIQRPSPARFVSEHYTLLNQHKYDTTWQRLSSNFQAKSGGYDQYVNWWNKVARIDIGTTNTVQADAYRAVVDARLVYVLKRGDSLQDDKPRIFLIWNEAKASWLIDNKTAR